MSATQPGTGMYMDRYWQYLGPNCAMCNTGTTEQLTLSCDKTFLFSSESIQPSQPSDDDTSPITVLVCRKCYHSVITNYIRNVAALLPHTE